MNKKTVRKDYKRLHCKKREAVVNGAWGIIAIAIFGRGEDYAWNGLGTGWGQGVNYFMLINKYAKEISNAKGKGDKDRIKRSFLKRLRKTMDELVEGGQRGGVERGGRNAKAGPATGTEGVKERGLFGETIIQKEPIPLPKSFITLPFRSFIST